MFRKQKNKKVRRKTEVERGFLNKLRKVLFFILLILFISVAFWTLFFSPLVKIQKIKIAGFQDDLIEEIVRDKLNSKYWGIIPQDNILLLFSGQIEKEIQEKLVLAQNIEVKKKFPSSLEIYFKERKNVVTWCQGDNFENCFLIDSNGEAFYTIDEEGDFMDNFPIVFNKGNFEINTGDLVVNSDLVQFYSEIGDYVKEEAGISLKRGYYTPSFMSNEIKADTDQGWFVYFDSASSAYEQSKLLKSVLSKETIATDLDNLEYIDLRFSDKVLYKMKNDNGDEKEEEGENNQEQKVE